MGCVCIIARVVLNRRDVLVLYVLYREIFKNVGKPIWLGDISKGQVLFNPAQSRSPSHPKNDCLTQVLSCTTLLLLVLFRLMHAFWKQGMWWLCYVNFFHFVANYWERWVLAKSVLSKSSGVCLVGLVGWLFLRNISYIHSQTKAGNGCLKPAPPWKEDKIRTTTNACTPERRVDTFGIKSLENHVTNMTFLESK